MIQPLERLFPLLAVMTRPGLDDRRAGGTDRHREHRRGLPGRDEGLLADVTSLYRSSSIYESDGTAQLIPGMILSGVGTGFANTPGAGHEEDLTPRVHDDATRPQ